MATDTNGRLAGRDAMLRLQEGWRDLDASERLSAFRALGHPWSEDFFDDLDARERVVILGALPHEERRLWVRSLDPDDVADVLQECDEDVKLRADLLGLLDENARREVTGLLAYAEDDAGGLMNPRFSTVRADSTADEALAYLRRRSRERLDTSYYVYVLDDGRPVGVMSLRRLLAATSSALVRDVMHPHVITVTETMDQEHVSELIMKHDLLAVPVVGADGRMKGIVTIDDIVDVVREEATEDIQKFGGMEALELPYLQSDFLDLVRKRGGWLAILFVSEMLTTTAMTHYEGEIQKAVVLAVFVPLIISSGGNSGSQASTLVIRALALGEVRQEDILKVARRELGAGLTLGLALGAIGFVRVLVWQAVFHSYTGHALGVALTVAMSLVGVVLFGCLSGSMLPFALRRVGLDPASASAPFVATLVDVTGLVIYFSVASVFLADLLK